MRYEVLDSLADTYVLPQIISLDTEYSELDIKKADLLSISIGVSPSLTYIIQNNFKLAQEFIDAARIIFTWNGVVDVYILSRNDVFVPKEKVIDGMLCEHLIDERLDHGLGDYAIRKSNDNYKDEFWSEYDRYQDAPKEVAYEYEMRDGIYTYMAGCEYLEQLRDKMPLVEHVHKLQWALFDTEVSGLRVNLDLIQKTKVDMGEKIASYLEKLREDYYEYCQLWEMQQWSTELSNRKSLKGKLGVRRPTFKFTSDTQVRWLVYDAMECPISERTKKGAPKTDYDTLKALSEDFPILKTLVEYKEIKGLYSTFVEGMLERVESDKRIYPHFNINGTHTGRISHTNPNMGNMPRDGVIRNFFIPDPGNLIVGADYSQLEVVVEANLTEDPNLLKIILEGVSKHDITAEGLGLPREQAKTLNFALQYGAGVNKIRKILGVSHSEADDIFKRYWELYSGVRTLKEKTCQEIAKNGYVTNLFGRTRHFEKPKNEFEKAKQERQAYNFLVQGVGADITNMATYRIATRLKREQLGRLWMSIHDEIIAEVRSSFSEEAKAAIVTEMEGVNDYVNFKYPVRAKSYGPLEYWSKA